MREFKIGDLVKIIKHPNNENWIRSMNEYNGKIATVESTTPNGVRVKEFDYFYNNCHIKLVPNKNIIGGKLL